MTFARKGAQLGPELAEKTGKAVADAVASSLVAASKQAVASVETAAKPLLEGLKGVEAQATAAENSLKRIVLWTSWRLLGGVVATVLILLLLGWLASAAVLWWDNDAIATAQARKAQLAEDIAQMRANLNDLDKSGMLGRCGPENRLCVRVDENAGAFGKQKDYRIIQVY